MGGRRYCAARGDAGSTRRSGLRHDAPSRPRSRPRSLRKIAWSPRRFSDRRTEQGEWRKVKTIMSAPAARLIDQTHAVEVERLDPKPLKVAAANLNRVGV